MKFFLYFIIIMTISSCLATSVGNRPRAEIEITMQPSTKDFLLSKLTEWNKDLELIAKNPKRIRQFLKEFDSIMRSTEEFIGGAFTVWVENGQDLSKAIEALIELKEAEDALGFLWEFLDGSIMQSIWDVVRNPNSDRDTELYKACNEFVITWLKHHIEAHVLNIQRFWFKLNHVSISRSFQTFMRMMHEPILEMKKALTLLNFLKGQKSTPSQLIAQELKSLGKIKLPSTKQIGRVIKECNDYLGLDDWTKSTTEPDNKRKASSMQSGNSFDPNSLEPESSENPEDLDDDSNLSNFNYDKNGNEVLTHVFRHLMGTKTAAITKEINKFRIFSQENERSDISQLPSLYMLKIASYVTEVATLINTHINLITCSPSVVITVDWREQLQKLIASEPNSKRHKMNEDSNLSDLRHKHQSFEYDSITEPPDYDENAAVALGHEIEESLGKIVAAIDAETQNFHIYIQENAHTDFDKLPLLYESQITPYMTEIATLLNTHMRIANSFISFKVNVEWHQKLQKLDEIGAFLVKTNAFPLNPRLGKSTCLLELFAIQHHKIVLKLKCLELHMKIQENYHNFRKESLVSTDSFKDFIKENFDHVRLLNQLETVLDLRSTGDTVWTRIDEVLFHFFQSPEASRSTEELITDLEKLFDVIYTGDYERLKMALTKQSYLESAWPWDILGFDNTMTYARREMAIYSKRKSGDKSYHKASKDLERAVTEYIHIGRILRKNRFEVPFMQYQNALSFKEEMLSRLTNRNDCYVFLEVPKARKNDLDASINDHSRDKTNMLSISDNTPASTSHDMHPSAVETSYYGSSSTVGNVGESSSTTRRILPSSLSPN